MLHVNALALALAVARCCKALHHLARGKTLSARPRRVDRLTLPLPLPLPLSLPLPLPLPLPLSLSPDLAQASALEAADKKDSSPAAATAVPNRPAQSLVTIQKATAAPFTARQTPPGTPLVFQVKPAAPADRIEKAVRGGASTAAGAHEKMPKAVAQMVQQGTWQGGETVAASPTTVLKKGPPLYTAADAKKDAAAMAAANAAMTAAEKVNAPDTVVHAKTSSKSVMQVPCRCCPSLYDIDVYIIQLLFI